MIVSICSKGTAELEQVMDILITLIETQNSIAYIINSESFMSLLIQTSNSHILHLIATVIQHVGNDFSVPFPIFIEFLKSSFNELPAETCLLCKVMTGHLRFDGLTQCVIETLNLFFQRSEHFPLTLHNLIDSCTLIARSGYLNELLESPIYTILLQNIQISNPPVEIVRFFYEAMKSSSDFSISDVDLVSLFFSANSEVSSIALKMILLVFEYGNGELLVSSFSPLFIMALIDELKIGDFSLKNDAFHLLCQMCLLKNEAITLEMISCDFIQNALSFVLETDVENSLLPFLTAAMTIASQLIKTEHWGLVQNAFIECNIFEQLQSIDELPEAYESLVSLFIRTFAAL